jgi:UDPglucose--hexose-1-phosphate uridylyltransferase
MPQLRRNPITGHWVIMAEKRGGRPQEVEVQQIIRPSSNCPFCEGQESRTPNEVLALRKSDSTVDGPGWQVRVVPNKYPALEEIEDVSAGEAESAQALNQALNTGPGLGIHEIIIESPRHLASLTELDDAEVAGVLKIYRRRLATLRQGGKFRRALIFKNGGPTAGATLTHLHSQLMAFELAEPALLDRLSHFESHHHRFGCCPLCQAIDELTTGSPRLVAGTENFLAFCPYASRFAYEVWLVPRRHVAHFDSIDPQSLPELAGLFRTVLVKLERIVKLPSYNYLVHTSPFDIDPSDHYHWHIEILPRTTSLAGFELGTGCTINTVLPDRAAAALREA